MRINALSVYSDSLCATASADSTVRVWDLRSLRDSRPVQSLSHSRDSVTVVAFLPPSASPPSSFVSASIDGCLRTYDVRRGVVTVDDTTLPVTAIDVSEYGDVVVAATTASRLMLVDRSSGGGGRQSSATILQQYECDRYKSEVYSVQCVLVDGGSSVVSGTESGNGLLRWDVGSGRLLDSWGETRQSGGAGVSGCVAWEQSNGVLLSGSTNGTVCVWDMSL